MKKRLRQECLPIDNGDGTARVPLQNGEFAIIDSCDIGRVGFCAWNYSLGGKVAYAKAGFTNAQGRRTMIAMHRLLLCFPYSSVDHVNGNGLDNRRHNLRPCDSHQNQGNSAKWKAGKYSKYKGVCKHLQSGLWIAQLRVGGKSVHTKYFRDEVEAARSYDKAAIAVFGEFACTNVSLGLLPPTDLHAMGLVRVVNQRECKVTGKAVTVYETSEPRR